MIDVYCTKLQELRDKGTREMRFGLGIMPSTLHNPEGEYHPQIWPSVFRTPVSTDT